VRIFSSGMGAQRGEAKGLGEICTSLPNSTLFCNRGIAHLYCRGVSNQGDLCIFCTCAGVPGTGGQFGGVASSSLWPSSLKQAQQAWCTSLSASHGV